MTVTTVDRTALETKKAARLARAAGVEHVTYRKAYIEATGLECNPDLWAACIGGAAQQDGYRAAIEGAGLRMERIEENAEYQFISDRARGATAKFGVKSVSILARKV